MCSSDLTLRRAATVGANAVRARKLSRVGVLVPTVTGDSLGRVVQSVVEGAIVANYDGGTYKTVSTSRSWLQALVIHVPVVDKTVTAGVERGRVLGECTNTTRELANLSGNILTPRAFAARATTMARAAGLTVDVIDEKRAAKLGMGLLLGVARGSAEPPRVVVLRHEPKGAAKGAVLGLVGKGVTFDTGGISIKPSAGMEDMKWDMAGSAAVVGVMEALAARHARVNAVGAIGLAENMPSGSAQRPSDIVKSMSGRTIEVLNTDAEGRLVLADVLWYTQDRFKPRAMVDLATLTGAIVVALGSEYAGLFSNNEDLAKNLQTAGKAVGENLWRMPLGDAYDREIDSDAADVKNISSGRGGGSIIGAQFLARFVNDVPWAHLDIAAMAWSKKDTAVTPKGATAFGVRLLDRLVSDYYEEKEAAR